MASRGHCDATEVAGLVLPEGFLNISETCHDDSLRNKNDNQLKSAQTTELLVSLPVLQYLSGTDTYQCTNTVVPDSFITPVYTAILEGCSIYWEA